MFAGQEQQRPQPCVIVFSCEFPLQHSLGNECQKCVWYLKCNLFSWIFTIFASLKHVSLRLALPSSANNIPFFSTDTRIATELNWWLNKDGELTPLNFISAVNLRALPSFSLWHGNNTLSFYPLFCSHLSLKMRIWGLERVSLQTPVEEFQ